MLGLAGLSIRFPTWLVSFSILFLISNYHHHHHFALAPVVVAVPEISKVHQNNRAQRIFHVPHLTSSFSSHDPDIFSSRNKVDHGKTIIGRAPSGVRALENDVAGDLNIEFGQTQHWVFPREAVFGGARSLTSSSRETMIQRLSWCRLEKSTEIPNTMVQHERCISRSTPVCNPPLALLRQEKKMNLLNYHSTSPNHPTIHDRDLQDRQTNNKRSRWRMAMRASSSRPPRGISTLASLPRHQMDILTEASTITSSRLNRTTVPFF